MNLEAVHQIIHGFSVLEWISVAITTILLWVSLKGLRSIYWHPLSKFPGPRLAAATNLYYIRYLLGGRNCFHIQQLHKKYGSVVRIAPNELSFATPSSLKAIYGHLPGQPTLRKSEFYNGSGTGFGGKVSVASLTDPIEHGRIRRLLSSAFSAKALAEQEDLVQHHVDKFVTQLHKFGSGPEGLDMAEWANFLTFDIIGDLAFGATFGAMETGKSHFWISLITEHIYVVAVVDSLRRFPSLARFKPWLIPKSVIEPRLIHAKYSWDRVDERINTKTTRRDFFSKILENQEAQSLTQNELAVNASTLVVAGSETSATWLAVVSYYLCRTPDAFKKLRDELDSFFSSLQEITAERTVRLQYLNAVIDEGLRIFPPASFGLSRVSNGTTVDGIYVPPGVELSSNLWTLTHSEEYFREPDRFVPERWLDESSWGTVKEASQPFSLGTRVCLGRNLAQIEMRLILSKLVFTYDLELVDKSVDWNRDSRMYILWEKPKLPIRIIPRVDRKVSV